MMRNQLQNSPSGAQVEEAAKDQLFFVGLKALAEAAFPKCCNNCGRVFETAQQFIAESQALRVGVTGLKQGCDEDERPIVEVYRNCPCGSTLMDLFSNRRDTSEEGAQRRQLFNTAKSHLISRGLSPTEARLCLVRLLLGDATEADIAAFCRNRLP